MNGIGRGMLFAYVTAALAEFLLAADKYRARRHALQVGAPWWVFAALGVVMAGMAAAGGLGLLHWHGRG